MEFRIRKIGLATLNQSLPQWLTLPFADIICLKRLLHNLMAPRRHDFRPPSRSDDEAYPILDTSRKSNAEGGRKACRPSGGAGKGPLDVVVSPQRIARMDTLRASASPSGLFRPITGSLTFEIVSWSL